MKLQRTLVFVAILAAAMAYAQIGEDLSGQWPVMGQNLDNTRNQRTETRITPSTVHSLAVKWVFTTGGDVSATPTISGDAVYVPDWAGNIFAVRKDTGQLMWMHQISEYNRIAGSIARVSPTIHGGDLIIGDIQSENAAHDGANMIAIDRRSGRLRWITQVDDHPAAIITGSPVVFGDVVFVGVSSNEEALARNNALSMLHVSWKRRGAECE
jgi:polyvinyl alcohol dehydrogenase (cytochrome)